jgi:organic radical activating enzyme
MDLTPYNNCLALTNSIFIANEEKPYRPCCWFREYIDATDINDYRQQLSKMDLEKTCDYCIKQDQGGEYSYRQHFKYQDEISITASFDNICNLRCITCTPSNSSLIIPDMYADLTNPENVTARKLYATIGKQAPKKISFLKDMLASMDFTNHRLNFSVLGGEPLINPAIFEFLDWLSDQPYAHKTTLSVTTNGTTYNEKLLKYLERFKTVGVQLSIDGIESDFEYIRSGANFEQLEKVCDSFYELTQKYDNFNMGCHYTLSWMNCLKFADFYNWMSSNYPNIADLYVSKLEQPDHYSIEILSLELRTKIYNEVIDKLTVSENEGYKNGLFLYKEHMLSTAFDTLNLEKFKYGIGILKYIYDVRRGTDSSRIINDFTEFTGIKI